MATDAFGNALGDAVVANMSSPSAADNRAALNAAERAADPERYTTPVGGSGLRVGGGGSGLRFDGSADSTIDRRSLRGCWPTSAARCCRRNAAGELSTSRLNNLLKFVASSNPSCSAMVETGRSVCNSRRFASKTMRADMKALAVVPAEAVTARVRLFSVQPSRST